MEQLFAPSAKAAVEGKKRNVCAGLQGKITNKEICKHNKSVAEGKQNKTPEKKNECQAGEK